MVAMFIVFMCYDVDSNIRSCILFLLSCIFILYYML